MQKISEEWLYLSENCFAKSFLEQILFSSFAQESNFTKFNVLSPRRPLRKITSERPKFKSVKVRPLPLKTDLIVMPGDLDAWELSLLLPTIKFFFETFFRFLQLTRNLTYASGPRKAGRFENMLIFDSSHCVSLSCATKPTTPYFSRTWR